MKSIFILIASTILSLNSIAQNNNSVSVLKRESTSSFKPVSVLNTNTDNELQILPSDKSIQRIWLEATNADVRKDNGNYIIRPQHAGEVVLNIYDDSNRMNRKLLSTQTLKAVDAPLMSATIAGEKGGSISKAELMKAETVDVECRDCINGVPEISECKISVAGKDVNYKEFTMKGNTIDPAIKEAFKSMPAGSKFYVEYIKTKMHDGQSAPVLSPLTFIITE
jgi:hypothetical protein